MSSTQPQIARSSDAATSLVFSVQGRVVECSTSRWRPEVFVAGIYPGWRVILLNTISARSSLPRACMQQWRAKIHFFCSRTSLSLSGNYFCNRCKPTVAVAGSAVCPPRFAIVLLHRINVAIVLLHRINVAIVLLHRITVAIVLLHRICRQYYLDRRHVRALLELQRRLPICTQLNSGTWTTNKHAHWLHA